MKIIDHGDWARYEPDPYPFEGLKQRVLFCRRESDGRDWYDFQQKELKHDGTVKMTILLSVSVVMATERDPSLLFPANCKLIEVDGLAGEHETYRRMRFDGRGFLPLVLPVSKTSLLVALHGAGLLKQWVAFVREHEDELLGVMLGADRFTAVDDVWLREAFQKLGWSDETRLKIFDVASKTGAS